MAPRTNRERTEFGQRLLAARQAAGLSQKAVQAAIGIPQSTLAELESTALSSGYTAQLAALYSVDPHMLATGEPAPLHRGVAQEMSLARPSVSPQRVAWELLRMGAIPGGQFELVVQDEAFGADIPPGCIMRLDPDRPPRAGWPVLVKDKDGQHYLRDYQMGVGGRWQAVARVRGFAPLDSQDDGLEIVAVMRGVDWP